MTTREYWNRLAHLGQNGDKKALYELADGISRKLIRFFEHRMSSQGWRTADDLAQDTLMRVLSQIRLRRYDPSHSFLGWAMRIAKNVLIDEIRRRGRQLQRAVLRPIGGVSEERDELARQELLDALDHCLDVLSDYEREVLRKRYHGNQMLKEIAGEMGVGYGVLKGQVDRARKKLCNCLREKGIQHC